MRRTSPGALFLTVVLTSVTLAGCTAATDGPTRTPSSAPPITAGPEPVDQSLAKYDSLRADLIAALEEKLSGITWSVDKGASLAKSTDGRCILQIASMKSSADIVKASNNFEDVFAAGDPVLAQHGFPAFGGTDDVPGGWVVARSTNGSGSTVTIESKSPAYLSVTVPVDSPNCDSAEIPAG
ncbi:hypothetical protein [Paenarthrobacter sp. NPDC018779]|uniref:hypothetical protein n=1 Tax=Paenarthrobacter sp. NPDC018779 TaxID=3364375 RepID=UPI0037CC9698